MSVGELRRIVRAFSVYFQLVNIAERYHRVRRRRQYEASPDNPPQRASVASALARLKDEGLGKEALRSVLEGMEVGLVLTAHPTEAMRRSVRRKHVRIGEMLESMESPVLTWRERRSLEKDLAEEITVLWQTDELRVRRPEVRQEMERTLLFFENPLISATLEAYREFEDELSRQYPEDTPTLGRVLEFGSWVGGDQDGNPFVEPEMITIALGLHREVILKTAPRLRAVAGGPHEPVGQDDPGLRRVAPLGRAGRKAHARRRRALRWRRPERGLPAQATLHGRAPEAAPSSTQVPLAAYADACRVPATIFSTIRDSLLRTAASASPKGDCGMLIRQAEVFGFHLAKLDVRQESVDRSQGRRRAGLGRHRRRPPGHGRSGAGRAPAQAPRRSWTPLPEPEDASEESRKVFETFGRIRRAKEEFSGTPVETFVLSMARHASDVLCVQLLARRVGTSRGRRGRQVYAPTTSGSRPSSRPSTTSGGRPRY